MAPTDLTTRVLIEIRDEIRSTNGRLDLTNERLERLEHRVANMNVQLSSDILALADAINDEVIHGHRGLRKRIEKCERDIEELKRKRRS